MLKAYGPNEQLILEQSHIIYYPNKLPLF